MRHAAHHSCTPQWGRSAFESVPVLSAALRYKFEWLKAVPDVDDLQPQFLVTALDALAALEGHGAHDFATQQGVSDSAVFDAREAWFKLFRAFGTHYVTSLNVGGKIIYTRCWSL